MKLSWLSCPFKVINSSPFISHILIVLFALIAAIILLSGLNLTFLNL